MTVKHPSSSRRAHSIGGQADERIIYMDHNATTPLDERVLEAMHPYLTERFGNAASKTHSYGRVAEEAVDSARGRIASLINADPKEILWTSGATESNNLAIKGAAFALREKGRHIITQATEHNAVLDPCTWLRQEGFDITVLPVDPLGTLDAQSVARAIRADTILVSVMYANNELGTLQPIREIGTVCRERDVLFHTDAAQAVGRVPIDVQADKIDLLSASAHKLYGPKGCGALYVRNRTPRIRLTPILHGGGHERGFRSGTINVPGVVGFGVACELSASEMKSEQFRLSKLRDQLERELLERLPDAHLNGCVGHRLPHVTSLTVPGVEAEALLIAMPQVALSTGSACTSAAVEPSHVLTAIGVSQDDAHRTLRFALGRFNTEDEVAFVADLVIKTVLRLRDLAGFH